MRLFIAVNIPDSMRRRLHEEAEELEKEGLFFGKITEKENIHLTLKFLGEIKDDKIGEIVDRLKEVRHSKFDVMLGNLGVFDEDFIRIIWAKLFGADRLQEMIDEELSGLFPKEERFMGHVTIARVKNVKENRGLIDRLKRIRLDNLRFKVESFELMSSTLSKDGAEYEVVEKFFLSEDTPAKK